ncbi:taste receptor type 2 member 8 [Hippopotamus amphibius kiboko]|uniref:taste receptor type 2 member 8 n=1 Tax=Hippopotamus amphibius kiboko TaxID=575201 RepID=UPI00259A19F9|nr:taste receptor type 2 member 8 [Hippopotamus amphibius kiboko]
MIIIIGESVIGVFVNGYIGLVIWIDWIKKKKILLIDYILTSLATSRICLLCVIAISGIIRALYPDVYENKKVKVLFNIFWTLTNYLSMWFATCLSVFYLFKIASFSHPLFRWLKWRISRVVCWSLLGSLAISLLIVLILVTLSNCDYNFLKTEKHKRNFTEVFHVSKIQYFDPLTLFNLLAIVPCTVSLISLFLLIMSLWRHTKQMKFNVTGCRDSSREAHLEAMKMVTLFLFLFFVYYLACLLATYSYLMKESRLVVMSGEIIAILYPLGHSLFLIIRNNKLRLAFVRMLKCGETA